MHPHGSQWIVDLVGEAGGHPAQDGHPFRPRPQGAFLGKLGSRAPVRPGQFPNLVGPVHARHGFFAVRLDPGQAAHQLPKREHHSPGDAPGRHGRHPPERRQHPARARIQPAGNLGPDQHQIHTLAHPSGNRLLPFSFHHPPRGAPGPPFQSGTGFGPEKPDPHAEHLP